MKSIRQLMKAPQIWAAAFFLAFVAEPAFAQNLDPITSMLTTVLGYLTGTIGQALAGIAVVAAGFAMFTGRLNWPWFLAILLGAVLVFSATTIIAGF